MKNLLYKFGRILSEGKGRQLLYLSALIVLVLAIIVLLVTNGGDQNEYKDMLGLFFGTDSISKSTTGVIGKLFIYILGTLLFTTALISVISNIFDNFSSSFKKGRLDVDPKGHVLFLGANHMLPAMLDALSKESDFNDIVVLTTSNIEDLRERLFSIFGSEEEKYKRLRSKLILKYGERDNQASLESVNPAFANDIYILGEDNEANHDGKSLAAADLLKNHKVRCKVFLEDSYSVHTLLVNKDKFSTKDFCLDIINIYDDIAEKALTEHPIDYSFSVKDGKRDITPGIKPNCEQHVHLVVYGHGQMSWAFVKTAFSMSHFPTFDEKSLKDRATITVIDENAGKFKNEFMSLYANIFLLSNVRYEYKESGARKVDTSSPSPEYGDFLDIDWEFIDGDINEPEIRTRLESWAADDSQSLSIALCDMDYAKNTGAALSLPRIIFEKEVPVFAYQPSDSDVLENIRSGFFDNSVFSFGMISGRAAVRQDDILFKRREEKAKRANFAFQVHNTKKDLSSIEDEWYTLSESDKLSNVYNAISIPIKKRSFVFEQLSDNDCVLLAQVEHRRWIAAELLRGRYPFSIKDRYEKKEEWNNNKKHFRDDLLLHIDIAPRDVLSPDEQDKDNALQSIHFIENGDFKSLIAQIKKYADIEEAKGEIDKAKELRDRAEHIPQLLIPANSTK